MLSRNGDRALIKILDFGLAKAGRENKVVSLGPSDAQPTGRVETLTLVGQMLGTPDFIAPEQIDDAQKADIRADIYSLGCTLYYLLSGRPPFQAETLYDVLQAHHSMDAQLLNFVRPEVPSELAALVAKMMAKEPGRRFQEPKEVAQALIPFFQKGASRPSGPSAEMSTAVSRTAATGTVGTASAPAQSPPPLPAVAPPGLRASKTGTDGVAWQSLIEIKDDEPRGNATRSRPAESKPAPAEGPVRRPPWIWPAIIAASILGLVALGVIIITIRGRNGETKITARDDTSFKVETPVVVVEHTPSNKNSPSEAAANSKDGTPSAPPVAQPQLTEVARFIGHEKAVEAPVVVSPDGRRILSGSDDHTLILWNRETAQPIRRLKGHTARVIAVAISPDGRRALSGGDDSIVRLWELDSGETIRTLQGHTECVLSVAFSPDGRLGYSTSGGVDQGGWQNGADSAVRVWKLETGEEVRKLEGLAGLVWSVAVSPDGRRVLACGNVTQAAIVWDAETGAEICRFREHHKPVICVAFLPDGRRAVSGGDDGMIRLWDVETGQELCRFNGYAGITYVAVSPDGRWLLSSAWDSHDLRLWDVATGRCLQRIVWPSWACRGSFTPDSSHAVWGGYDGIIRMYRLMGTDQRSTKGAAASGTGASQSPKPEGHQRVENSIGMKLMLIAAGEFLMGSADDAIEAEADEKPRHRVRITKPFYLGTCEVTQGQYEAVMGKNPSYFSLTGGGADQVGGSRRLSIRSRTSPGSTRSASAISSARRSGRSRSTRSMGPMSESRTGTRRAIACQRRRSGNTPAGRVPRRYSPSELRGRSYESTAGSTRTPSGERTRWARNGRIRSASMTCTGMYGSGAGIGTARNSTLSHPRMTRPVQWPRCGSYAAEAYPRIRVAAGRPAATLRRRGDCGPTMASERPVGLLTAELRRAERGATPKRSRSKAVRVRIRFRRPDRASIIGRRGEAACHRELTLLSRPQPRRGKFTPGVAFRLR